MIPLRAFLLMLITALPALVQAADAAGENILARLKQARPDLDFAEPKPSPVDGLYEVQVANGPLIYVSADGGYFFAGDLFAVQDGGFVNLGEQQRQAERRELIAAVNPQDMIIFAPVDATQLSSTLSL